MDSRIIIIGSGLSGLAFAQGLQKSGIPFKIYESGAAHSIRTQGYRIRLHGEGLIALRSVLTTEIWDLFEETCAATVLGPLPFINALTCEISAAKFSGNNPQSKMAESDQKPYTVDRGILREVLLTGLEDHIVYEQVYSHYTLTPSGITAHFADGTSETGRMLVGADGVHSAVRRQYLPHLRVLDTKSRPVYGKTPLTPFLEKRLLQKAMDCLSLIKDPQTGSTTLMEVIRFLPAQQRKDKRDLPNDYIYWVIITPESKGQQISSNDTNVRNARIADLARTMTSHWHPSLTPLIEDQDSAQTGMFRLLSTDPESLSVPWEPDSRITIIGDAAHAMLPSTASGAVTALRDAALLSRLIREGGD